MAITTSAGDGVRITTPAWCGVATAGAATSVTVNGRWAVGCNQNNGNTCACITFSCRIVVLRQGTCTEEIRFITGETPICACDDTTLTVHEAWCTNPSACDTVDVSYVIQDAATVTGLGLLTKRLQDYGSTRVFNVGNTGCAPAYALFAMVKGVSLESCGSQMANCAPDVEIENNGHFVNGYTSNGIGVNGGYFVFANQTAGRCGFRANNGAILSIIDNQEWYSVSNPEHRILGSCSSGTVRSKNIFGTRQLDITAPSVAFECMRIQGQDNTCDVINVGGTGLTVDGLELIDMGAIRNINQNTCSETFTFQDVVFVSNAGDIVTMQGACSNNKTFVVRNPKYTTCPPTCDITLLGAASTVQEQFRNTVTVQNPDGTKINGAILNHISTRCATSAIRITTCSNACGVATLDIEQRRWTGACETLATSTAHGLQVHNYACQSFATVPTVANKTGGFGQCLTVAVSTDTFVCEACETTALADGTLKMTICENQCQAHSIIKFTGGCGTLTVGKWIGVCNGACAPTIYGRVKEISEGNSTAGTVALVDRSGASFTANLVEYECSACAPSATKLDWTGTFTCGQQYCFTWNLCVGTISCVARTAQQAYDNQKAKLHENPIDTADNWDDVKRWGVGEHPFPLQGCGNKFKTVRNVANAEGWMVTGLASLGALTVLTEDDGTTFSPAASVCVSVTANNEGGCGIQGARVGIFTDPVCTGDTALISGNTNACGVVSTCITVAGDTNVVVRIRKKGFIPFETTGTISATTGLTVTATLIKDPAVNLP